MIDIDNMTDEEASQLLEEMRKDPINAALQDLGQFVLHTLDNHGKVTPETALCLAKAAENAVTVLLNELRELQQPLEDMPALGNA